MKSYEDILEYIYSIPMFQNIGQMAYNPSLDRTLELVRFLGNPQDSFRTIHIAGTNGKGSSSTMIASVLRESGFKVGLYTSPHLIDYRERITINGELISKNRVLEFMEIAYDEMQRRQPSFFEFTTALAFWCFRAENIDIAVIEVGLGGRIDSTNVISSLATLITNIGYDHKNILGETLEEIAWQKAGIIKQNTPIVVSQYLPQTRRVFEQEANGCAAPMLFAQDQYTIEAQTIEAHRQIVSIRQNGKCAKDYILSLCGAYQAKNLLGVVALIDMLNSSGRLQISEDAISRGLAKCSINGRWQVLGSDPLVVCDVGHNIDGISEVVEMIHNTKHNELYMVIGFMADKDVDPILDILPHKAKYIAVQANGQRAMSAEVLSSKLTAKGLNSISIPNIPQAVKYATKQAKQSDMVFIGGSCFVVAEVIAQAKETE